MHGQTITTSDRQDMTGQTCEPRHRTTIQAYTLLHIRFDSTFTGKPSQPLTMSTAPAAATTAAITAAKPIKSNKEVPKNLVIPPKKPKLNKAERRALQESQRADKGNERSSGIGSVGTSTTTTTNTTSSTIKKVIVESSVLSSNEATPSDSKAISSLAHLPPYRGS